MEADIYYCTNCDKYIRTNKLCPECGNAGDRLGWLHSNEEM
jgi:ribosomal protein L32